MSYTDPQQPPAQPAPATPVAASAAEPEVKGFSGMFNDPSTLASTGLLLAVLCSVAAGVFNFLTDSAGSEIKQKLMALTDTVDVGDVALLGIAVALLVVTPDPPGGIDRGLLLKAGTVLGAAIAIYDGIRAIVVLTQGGEFLAAFAGFLATAGVAIAAATVAFYAAKESFMKPADPTAEPAAA